MVVGLGRAGILPPRPSQRKANAKRPPPVEAAPLGATCTSTGLAGTPGGVACSTPTALEGPPSAVTQPRLEQLLGQQELGQQAQALLWQAQQQQQEQEPPPQQLPHQKSEQQQPQQQLEHPTHSHHSAADWGPSPAGPCTAGPQGSDTQQLKRKQPDATASGPSSQPAGSRARTQPTSSGRRRTDGGATASAGKRKRRKSASGGPAGGRAEYGGLLGLTVEVPGSVFS